MVGEFDDGALVSTRINLLRPDHRVSYRVS